MDNIIREVTGLYPVKVKSVIEPSSVNDLIKALKNNTDPISIGGGRFSMGGQISSPDSLHIDMRKMNQVIFYEPKKKKIKVQAGMRWKDVQEIIDKDNLSLKVMQTYADFTVGGSISVNAHGRYIGFGPLIYSVLEIVIITADGTRLIANKHTNPNVFYGAIGGYGGLGIIVEATLSLVENSKVKRVSKVMDIKEYQDYFKKLTANNKDIIFHNADIYPNHYSKVRATSWIKTNDTPTVPDRLNKYKKKYLLEKYFFWSISETKGGKWRRENLLDPILFSSRKVHWRNYEAGYDVLELEPKSRKDSTYVLQEYFIPIRNTLKFTEKAKEILNRYNVNVINISIRHALKDPGSLLAWAKEEVFAFVLYYKQGTTISEMDSVEVWTRELIQASIDSEGCYYLPYQAHASHEQFHKAYPKAIEFFKLKEKLDPEYKIRNILWDTYYKKTEDKLNTKSEFLNVMSTKKGNDNIYLFLQNVFHLYPEHQFQTLIKDACSIHTTDEAIYRYIQEKLSTIKPFLSELSYMIPALKVQKKEMRQQTIEILGEKTNFNGYLEIGSKGRYLSAFKNDLKINGNIYIMDDNKPTNAPSDILERGAIKKIGKHIDLNDYEGIKKLPDNSVELVVCYIGIHHIKKSKLENFIYDLKRVMKKDGVLLLRDHNADTPEMVEFASLIHTIFNMGLNESWEFNKNEYRNFQSISYWKELLSSVGFSTDGVEIYQKNDPSKNALLKFKKD